MKKIAFSYDYKIQVYEHPRLKGMIDLDSKDLAYSEPDEHHFGISHNFSKADDLEIKAQCKIILQAIRTIEKIRNK